MKWYEIVCFDFFFGRIGIAIGMKGIGIEHKQIEKKIRNIKIYVNFGTWKQTITGATVSLQTEK